MDKALKAAVDWLLASQDSTGWWSGELETNVTMTAEHVLLLQFLGVSLDPIRQESMKHILRNQRADGSWALYFNGPADLSTTLEAYVALKVLGMSPSDAALARALRLIHQQGGLANTRVFTKIWMALFGEYPWDGVPSMPPELIHLSPSAPLNLYDFACWARGTVAPLLIVISRRPVRSLGCGIQETIVPGTEPAMHRVPGSGAFWWADALMKLYEGLPGQPLRSRARSKIVDWIVERQEADGSWGGIQPPWVYSLIALSLEGMSLDHPVMRKGLSGLDGFALADAEGWRLQACMSPVWDTAWAILALRWAGVERSHGSLLRAVEWTLSEQIQNGGDWEIRCPPGTPSGGWAFEFQNDVYPDIDDTAVVAVALLDASERPDIAPALDRACRWVLAMRSDNGAWAAFDRNNTSEIVYKLPFADFGAMLDPPSEDVTAHVLEMLVRLGYAGSHPAVAGALRYLAETQTPEGAWFGRWGSNYIYGTWCVLSALRAFARPGPEIGEMVRRGTKWMLEHQNHDGGWGETLYSYEDPSFAGVGISAPSQTAWAVMSLQFAEMGGGKAAQRGLEFLRERQVDGTWPELEYTGTGFPRDFYINYHLYRHVFPTMALAASECRPCE